MLKWLRQRRAGGSAKAENQGTPVYLERKGADRVERLVHASIKPSRWLTVLELAWTAGPVTIIAAMGGYYIGFGTALPQANLKFFVGYTVIAGVVGLGARGIYMLTRGRREEQARDDLLQVTDRLPDLIFAVRDLHLSSLDLESRRIEGARLMLRKVDLGPEWVALAVTDLTGDATLGEVVEQIDIYRRVGMYSRIDDLRDLHAERIEQAIARLGTESQEIAELLAERCRGLSPNVKTGSARADHFIERILAAVETENDALMTLLDVEEILLLAFELISGRSIPMLVFEYKGDFQRQRATDQLEAERGRYRIARARGTSRLLALATFLDENHHLDSQVSVAAINEASMLEQCRSAMNRMAWELRRRSRELSVGGRRSSVRRLSNDLATACELYETTYSEFLNVGKVHADFLRGIERWERMLNEGKDRAALSSPQRQGLQIHERSISLDQPQQVALARQLASYFRERGYRLRGRQLVFADRSGNQRLLGREEIKRLAVELALMLDPLIHITRPEVQRAIDTSNAIFMGAFEPGLSAMTKIGWAEATAKSVESDLSRTAEHLAMALVSYYRIELDKKAIDWLANKYQANRDRLRLLAQTAGQGDSHNVSYLSNRPMTIPEPNPRWRHSVSRARTALLPRQRSRIRSLLGSR